MRSGVQVSLTHTWHEYGDLLINESARLGIEPATALAVLSVESGGAPHGIPGSKMPILRFEPHILWDRWGKANPIEFLARLRFVDGHRSWKGKQHEYRPGTDWHNVHINQSTEQEALGVAISVAGLVAYECASFGIAQIMGFWWKRLGYSDAADMVKDLQSPSAQVLSLFKFIETDPDLLAAVRAMDWTTTARIYNGTGQVEHYSAMMAKAYAYARTIVSP